MNRSRQVRLRIGATVFSAAAHIAVLTVLALQAPVLQIVEEAGPPEPVIPIILLPRTPPAAVKPEPIKLHHRPVRGSEQPSPIPPLPAPAKTPAAPAPGNTPVEIHPAPLPQGPKGDLRATLRGSPVGCGNAVEVGLNRAEREHCDEVLGKGAKTADFTGLGLEAGKTLRYDQAAAAKERERRIREAPLPAGELPGSSGQPWAVPDPLSPK
jgi:hypothetical protein